MGNKESHQSEATTSLEDRQNKKSRRKSTKYEKTPEKVEAKPAPPSPLSIAPPPSNAPVKKIAILGGGPSALATAYYLTNIPDWKSKYQITIYQMGWRLGGKAASSRNPDYAYRIEEHGIHIFGNYYKNIFDMVKKCNDETEWKYIPTETMEDTFSATGFTCNILYYGNHNQIAINRMALPFNNSKPWEGTQWYASEDEIIFTLLDTMWTIITGQHLDDPNVDTKIVEDRNPLENFIYNLGEGLENLVVSLGAKILKGLLKKLTRDISKQKMENSTELTLDEKRFDSLIEGLEKLLHWVKVSVKPLIIDHIDQMTTYIQLDLYITLTKGIIEDRLFLKDVDSVDHLSYAEWLTKHGIDTEITLPSPICLIAINSCFQFVNGDSTKRSDMSAAAFILFNIRALLGRGGLIWRWIAGTGEVIMSPFYATLKKRGVHFKFFHKVEQLNFTGDEITSINIAKQANVKGKKEYDPVKPFWVDKYAKPFWIWGHEPDYDQLENADEIKKHDLESYWDYFKVGDRVLKKGRDFDQVVLAISIGALPSICKDIIKEKPKWKDMVDHVLTTQTQAVQMWCHKTMKEMGFPLTFNPPDFCVGATFCYPINAFMDFSDLIEVEKWPDDKKPKTCLYFCGAKYCYDTMMDFNEKSYPQQQWQMTLYTVTQYMQSHLGQLLLPKATIPEAPTSFDFSHLVCLHGEELPLSPAQRMTQQYVRSNFDPTELYVISAKNSAQYRLHAWESGFKNLVLAGDWIYTGFNIGSIEAAVMSGALACFALTGLPDPETIQGYFFMHPNQREFVKNVAHAFSFASAPTSPTTTESPAQTSSESTKKKERTKTK